MRALNLAGAAVVAVGVTTGCVATANAEPLHTVSNTFVDVTPYLDGDTAYFSMGGVDCSIDSSGDVGCDIPAGQARWYGIIPVTDLRIDVPWLPAHPTFGLFGPQGRADSLQLPPPAAGDGNDSITYAGATCYGGGSAGVTGCNSKGRSFSFGVGGTKIL